MTWPGHRTSNQFARFHHQFPASAKDVVLLMDERFGFFLFFYFLFFSFLAILVPGFFCIFRILEIAAYRTMCGSLFVEYYRTFRQVRE